MVFRTIRNWLRRRSSPATDNNTKVSIKSVDVADKGRQGATTPIIPVNGRLRDKDLPPTSGRLEPTPSINESDIPPPVNSNTRVASPLPSPSVDQPNSEGRAQLEVAAFAAPRPSQSHPPMSTPAFSTEPPLQHAVVQQRNHEGTLTKVVNSPGWKVVKLIVGVLKDVTSAFPIQGADGLVSMMGNIMTTTENVESNACAMSEAAQELRSFLQQIDGVEKLLDKVVLDKDHKEKIQKHVRYINDGISKSWFGKISDAQNDKEMVKEIQMALFHARQVVLIQITTETYASIEAIRQQLTLSTKLRAVEKAVYTANVANRQGCTKGTRESILEDLRQWANGTYPRIYWMNGMAGTGKTTIAYSFCKGLGDRLVANFFCSRTSEEVSDVEKVIPTIASQIADNNPTFAAALLASLHITHPGNSPLEHQFHQYLLHPAIVTASSFKENSIVVWDGADECTHLPDVRKVLSHLIAHVHQLPFKIFIASRPEADISICFPESNPMSKTFLLHGVEGTYVKADIRVYVTEFLGAVRKAKGIRNWPDPKDIETLVERSDKLFIYAATVCHYLADPHLGKEETKIRFTELIRLSTEVSDTNKYAILDLLYLTILRHAGSNIPDGLLAILATMQNPLSINIISALLNRPWYTIERALSYLASVLSVSGRESSITLFHASFAQFIIGVDRVEAYVKEPHMIFVYYCFSLMDRCAKSGSGASTENSQALQYASHHWISHVIESRTMNLHDDILKFEWFPFWRQYLESSDQIREFIVRLLGYEQSLVTLNGRLSSFYTRMRLIAPANSTNTQVAWLACKNIIAERTDAVWDVAFSPDSNQIALVGSDRSMHIHNVESGMPGPESALTYLVVYCVAYSPDGQLIISGCEDKTIQIWDAKTLRLKETLTGHSEWVWSVAFSPDSKLIVSGSWDKTVRIWDAETGKEVMTLEGHLDFVFPVGFSPSGEWIASGSADGTIRIWCAKTGKEERKLEWHSFSVNCVAFSPDGEWIASGSEDKTVRVWNVKTGEVGRTLRGHTRGVVSVAYSPDGRFIVSGSYDTTIRVWNAENGREVIVLEGHLERVKAVAFSPDGKWIASGSGREDSGSRDNTVRLWDWRALQNIIDSDPL